MKKTLFACIIALSSLACKKDSTTPTPTPTGSVVYVSGTAVQPSNNSGTPCIWKDGVRTDLPIPANSYGGAATMAQSGTDLYAVATLYVNGVLKPVYWKNGVRVDLIPANGAQEGTATGICISGKDVYICGMSHTANGYYPTVWKNDVSSYFQDVIDPSKYSYATAIALNGQDQYVVGYSMEGNFKMPVYWKNGTMHRLNRQGIGTWGLPNTIVFDGNTRYIAGVATDVNDQHWGGKMWVDDQDALDVKNNLAQDNKIEGNIAANGGAVYSAGYYNIAGQVDQACYWKNGDLTVLNPMEQGKPSRASSIKLVNGKIYVCGWGYDIRGIKRALVWKDGVSSVLAPVADNMDAYPYDILIGN